MSEDKYCRDCKYFAKANGREGDACMKNPQFDLVSGEMRYKDAQIERYGAPHSLRCGHLAQFFEPKHPTKNNNP
jgi:hypothetical protein